MDLFNQSLKTDQLPLAERLRPKSIHDLVGQEKVLTDHQQFLKRLERGHLQSLILWGPPGSGKTSFALSLETLVPGRFYSENAIELGSKRIRELGEICRRALLESGQKSVLFIDEIHRLNRGQQDVLLPYVERGYFYLIGATTENPSYELNGALMSRCRLLVFDPLSEGSLSQLLHRACHQADLQTRDLLTLEAETALLQAAHGDGRRLYQMVEELLFRKGEGSLQAPLTADELKAIYQGSGLRFDKRGDEHYDTISALIKSVRGSDPDAGVYYLARLLEGGEDPRFIARRLLILASEDIGNADPQALSLALNVFRSVELLGLPEARIPLAQLVTYLSCAPKSNRSYMAINRAQAEVRATGPQPIPKALRSAQTDLMKTLGYGAGYQYSHEGERGWVEQDFLPEGLQNRRFYEPSERGFERRLGEYLAWLRGQRPEGEKS